MLLNIKRRAPIKKQVFNRSLKKLSLLIKKPIKDANKRIMVEIENAEGSKNNPM
tara:strand:+ start:6755 stop:6916 length:162 start_codon:yes stop_codon:yes gene_type:complete